MVAPGRPDVRRGAEWDEWVRHRVRDCRYADWYVALEEDVSVAEVRRAVERAERRRREGGNA